MSRRTHHKHDTALVSWVLVRDKAVLAQEGGGGGGDMQPLCDQEALTREHDLVFNKFSRPCCGESCEVTWDPAHSRRTQRCPCTVGAGKIT